VTKQETHEWERREICTKFWPGDLEARSYGTPGRRCEDCIKTYLREILCKHVDWIHMAQDGDHWRDLVNSATKLRVGK
jgi:hypothetical protein